jgi:uncharacterized repeat protein (TIGR03803 family)
MSQGRDGNVIGSAQTGGQPWGLGYVYKEQPETGALGILYNFEDPDGAGDEGGANLFSDGNYYGVLPYAGPYNAGSLFRITPSGVFTSLHAFTGGSDGAQPWSAPVEGSDGNLYGTSTGGGGLTTPTVYQYTAQGVFSVIYSFPTTSHAAAPVLEGSDGFLYITDQYGGAYNCGQILKMTKAGVVTLTHNFNCQGTGASPNGQLIEARDGSIYGVTSGGGAYNNGILYRLNPSTFAEKVLHNFGSTPYDGYNPGDGVIQGSDGNFYGTTVWGGAYTCGTIYQLSESGDYSHLYSFAVATFGCPFPIATPFQNTDGRFFGGTQYGGDYGYGTLYTFDMGLDPFVSFVQSQGPIGSRTQILGQGLTGATSVTFNGVPATSFAVVEDTFMTAVVPAGATSGPVVVTTPTGALTSNKNFRISE